MSEFSTKNLKPTSRNSFKLTWNRLRLSCASMAVEIGLRAAMVGVGAITFGDGSGVLKIFGFKFSIEFN